ncbi:hypothetical protein [Williamsia sterculiae]|uniref:Uncharacterized protein n=1 Tax=Williamsia sterculiae TaxID=1344003 RepID=A0A1N7EDS9_9NOCA|nr:hypothetical protein [Williamsia sterculiae]SIR86194.1 hypothetical protein SAMN05445060_1193 [Williamsia sterculiae]
MWWKVLLAALVVWLAFGLIVAVVKGLFWLLVVGLVVIGAVTAVKRFTGAASRHEHV